MNTVPSLNPIPTSQLVVNGLELLAVLVLLSCMLIFVGLLWEAWKSARARVRVQCPLHGRPARVVFRLSPEGAPIDVLRCTLFARERVTCGKACLR